MLNRLYPIRLQLMVKDIQQQPIQVWRLLKKHISYLRNPQRVPMERLAQHRLAVSGHHRMNNYRKPGSKRSAFYNRIFMLCIDGEQ